MKLFGDVAIVMIVILVLISVFYLGLNATDKLDRCKDKGGVLVKAHGGYICAKIEEIKL